MGSSAAALAHRAQMKTNQFISSNIGTSKVVHRIIRQGLAVLCIIRIICIIQYYTVLRIHIP